MGWQYETNGNTVVLTDSSKLVAVTLKGSVYTMEIPARGVTFESSVVQHFGYKLEWLYGIQGHENCDYANLLYYAMLEAQKIGGGC